MTRTNGSHAVPAVEPKANTVPRTTYDKLRRRYEDLEEEHKDLQAQLRSVYLAKVHLEETLAIERQVWQQERGKAE